MAFRHPHCDGYHDLVADARNCEDPNTFRCDWLLPVNTEDGPGTVECGAWSRVDDRGWACEAGHSHVYAEVRHAEGWDYAYGDGEARNLLGQGVDVVSMRGDSFLWGEVA